MGVRNLKAEIRMELDRSPKHRELLFRRGYLLTDGRFSMDAYPFYGLWNEYQLGRYALHIHQTQTAYIEEANGVSVALVGHAYDPFTMVWDEKTLCTQLLSAYQEGLSAYFDKVSELTGLHVILLFDGERLVVCQDACALTGCYFGKIQDVVCVAEHPQLIADLFDLTMDSMVETLVQSKCYNIGNRHLPGNLTPYKELKRLGGNTYLEYREDFAIHRFYPTAPHAEFSSAEEKDAAVRRIGELIHNGIACATEKWERCTISLSGGTDSKTTLACANGLYDRLSYYSYNSKPQELVDAEGARVICEKLGLAHTLYNIPIDNEEIEDFAFRKRIIQHSTGYFKNLSDNEIRKYLFFHDLDAYDVELKSWASEVARVFLERKYDIHMPERLNERHCSIFQTRYFGHPKLLKWSDREYYRFLREIGLEKPLFNYEHADLYYWEVRMGCWGCSVISSQQMYHRLTIPMNNRKLLDIFLCFPHEERKSDSVHKRVMDYMNQSVREAKVEIPNLYFHGYRILMEKLYYRLRTLFYRPIRPR